MNIQAEKLEIIRLLLETDNKELVEEIKKVFQKQGFDFWEDLPASVKDSIQRGLDEVYQGRVLSHESVMEDIKNKYGSGN